MIGRAVFGFVISLTGAGILIGFAAGGAVGIVGQRCAALWSRRARIPLEPRDRRSQPAGVAAVRSLERIAQGGLFG
jgi:hypothetical protein